MANPARRATRTTGSSLNQPPVRILGLDPGTARTGFGLVERAGQALRMKDCGLITTPAGEPAERRLAQLAMSLEKVLAETRPDAVAVERLFFATNTTTALAVAEARGVILLTCARAGLAVAEYTPLEVKQSVTAYGQADKQQVAGMVCRLLKLASAPKPDDVTDALAIAVCHSQRRPTIGKPAGQPIA